MSIDRCEKHDHPFDTDKMERCPSCENDLKYPDWCCLTCAWKGGFLKLRTERGSSDLHCPSCGSTDIHPINTDPKDLAAYHGNIPATS